MRRFPRLLIANSLLGVIGCSNSTGLPAAQDLGGRPDREVTGTPDLTLSRDLACAAPNACGHCEEGCVLVGLGFPDGPFPLGGSVGGNANLVSEADSGVKADRLGYLTMGGPGPQGNPYPWYELVIRGCHDAAGKPLATDWRSVSWQSMNDPMTDILVAARSGNTEAVDMTWGSFTRGTVDTPLDLSNNLKPNLSEGGDGYLKVQFVFRSSDRLLTPRLAHVLIMFDCRGRL